MRLHQSRALWPRRIISRSGSLRTCWYPDHERSQLPVPTARIQAKATTNPRAAREW